MGHGWRQLDPRTSTAIWRVSGLLLLTLLWLSGPGGEAGVVLLLLLAIMAVARWRFALPGWTVLLDQLFCFGTVPFWPGAVYGLGLPLFEAVREGRAWLVIPGMIGCIYFQPSFPLVAVLLQAALSGWVIREWAGEVGLYRAEADRQRRERYELESLRAELLTANVRIARMAEITERNRIAQDLHDNVGHELTGAVLALQAFERLWEERDPLAAEMLSHTKERLTKSARQLREAAHRIKPLAFVGIERFEEICRGFTACPLQLHVFGDTSDLPVYLWSVLEACLKEGLTNVIRHSQATQVDVVLDVNPFIVRLCVQNDGEAVGRAKDGVGLRNLRQRARAVGGSISVNDTNGFRLVCVLPLRQRNGIGDTREDEA
ncbi:MAG: histidine kinase [Peptococcaceae bacterium 1109]|jgi:signal transduction histidine kinase|nr:MAG: histidine kinase [Peptococcaceae bacterium 1109]